ncbi:unnamed protein product [Rhizophagus irregularis]|uniref:Uncharacterized protein n=1 Tax=Rhizophagus irregularis TaxID=588596 RepID=A0A2N1NG90_9GLOM|nr:hypothetical protein RhiirC2_710051 [Rhizophagus irregularis]CAB4379852.1 unnamed protein product [Rhizophagus irregularis]CAB5376926.1 unnamed protein product [Rhizophagus irregularis]
MHQVFELIIRGKVSLLTEADPTAFNDPCDDTYRDTFKDREKQKIILRSSTGILLPYGSSGTNREASNAVSIQYLYTVIMFKKVLVPWVQKRCKVTNKIYLVAKVGRYVIGIVVKFDKSIEHQQIRGNSVSSSVNKLIEHRQTGETSAVPSVNKLVQHQQTREKSVSCKEIINTPIYQK